LRMPPGAVTPDQFLPSGPIIPESLLPSATTGDTISAEGLPRTTSIGGLKFG
jgi:hypothetical protein